MSGWVFTSESASRTGLIGAVEAPADSASLLCGWINPFRGWILHQPDPGARDRLRRPQALRVYAGDRRVGSCQCGFSRPDLLETLKGDEAAEAGFSGYVYLPAPFVSPLRLVAVLRDGQALPFAEWPPGTQPERPTCFGHLDRKATPIPGDSDRVEVSGWAFLPGCRTGSVEVTLDGQPPLACEYPVPREDVAKRFPQEPQAGLSGFRAVFPRSGGKAVPVIRVRLSDPTGRSADLL